MYHYASLYNAGDQNQSLMHAKQALRATDIAHDPWGLVGAPRDKDGIPTICHSLVAQPKGHSVEIL